MDIELNKPFAGNGGADEYDVRQMKKALNRLGYYMPYDKTGITGIPDRAVFTALKSFQKDTGLRATGTAKPGDETMESLNGALAKKPDGQYMWRSVGDSRVRPEHAALDGTVRDFSDSPDPGDEINCRCWAEPVGYALGLTQRVISPINDKNNKWNWVDFLSHFYRGKGRSINLTDAGLLTDVINHAKSNIFERVEDQVERIAQAVGNGSFSDDFFQSYDFGSVSFSLGNSTVKGKITGSVLKQDKILIVMAKVEYSFYDQFTDPASLRQHGKAGTSASEKADPYTELLGAGYNIIGDWVTEITGTVEARN